MSDERPEQITTTEARAGYDAARHALRSRYFVLALVVVLFAIIYVVAAT